MKPNITLFFGILLFSISGISQTIPTIGEIYDFQPGDVFHKRTAPPSYPPCVSRITILDRNFSPSGDTVYYQYKNDSYSSTLVNNPMHLEYTFNSYEGFFTYFNLDSLITTEWYNDTSEYNDTSWSSSWYCNTSTISHSYVNWTYVDLYACTDIYGIGLGIVYSDCYNYEYSDYMWYTDMFYFKKGTVECGTPDLTTEDIADYLLQEPVYVYPTPFDDEIYIEQYSSSELKVELLNSQGQILTQCICSENNTKITTDDLVSGVYYLRILNTGNGHYAFRKLIKIH